MAHTVPTLTKRISMPTGLIWIRRVSGVMCIINCFASLWYACGQAEPSLAIVLLGVVCGIAGFVAIAD